MAIISHSRKVVFIHIAKTGGTAVSRWLMPKLASEDVVVMEGGQENTDTRGIFLPKYQIAKHSPAINFAIWMRDNGYNWNDYKSFAIIRHPEGRAISLYYEILHHGEYWAKLDAGVEWWKRFKECEGPDDFITSGLYTPDGPLMHTRPQLWFVHDGTGRIIVSRLFRWKTLSTEVPKYLGLEGGIQIWNKSRYPHKPLGDEAKAALQERYSMDYTLYSFIGEPSNYE